MIPALRFNTAILGRTVIENTTGEYLRCTTSSHLFDPNHQWGE